MAAEDSCEVALVTESRKQCRSRNTYRLVLEESQCARNSQGAEVSPDRFAHVRLEGATEMRRVHVCFPGEFADGVR